MATRRRSEDTKALLVGNPHKNEDSRREGCGAPANKQENNESSDATLPTYTERRIVLLDGTQVVVENEHEYMVTGPEGASIVLNCLPLYCVPRNETVQLISSASDNESAPGVVVERPSSVELVAGCNGVSTAADAGNSDALPRCNGDAVDRSKWEGFDDDSTNTRSSQPSLPDELASSSPNPLLTVEVADGVSEPSDLPQVFNAFEDNFSPAVPHPNPPLSDVFLTVDPFATELPNPLETRFTFSGIYNSTEEKRWDLSDSDDEAPSEEVDFQVKYIDAVSSMAQRSAAVTFTTSHGACVDSPRSPSDPAGLYATPLPPPPTTVFPRYSERGGWLVKLSHRKGVFGDKWQKRYFLLDGCTLRYYKKMGDPIPKGVIHFLPGSWCEPVTPGTERMADATVNQSKTSLITANRCLAVHRPNNHAASICRLLASEGVTEAFNSQSVAFVNPQDTSRTFYMVAPSDRERDEWVEAIRGNISAYIHSSLALQSACSQLKVMLQSVGCGISDDDLPSVLLLLYQQTETITERQRSFCQAHKQSR